MGTFIYTKVEYFTSTKPTLTNINQLKEVYLDGRKAWHYNV